MTGVDILSNLIMGMGHTVGPVNVWFCFIGVLLGTLVGVLPGLGPTATWQCCCP